MYDNSGFETVRRWYRHATVRRLELVGLGSTTIAFALTVWLAGSAYAVESNPFARELVATLGWVGAGSLALLLEGAIFEGYRRLERGAPPAARAGAALVAAIGVGDVLVNLWVLSRVGVPAGLSNRLLGAVAIATLVAVGVASREVLLEAAIRPSVSTLLIGADRARASRAPSVALLLTFAVVLSAAAGGLAVSSVGVNGSTYTVFEDDFEDGTTSFSTGSVSDGVYNTKGDPDETESEGSINSSDFRINMRVKYGKEAQYRVYDPGGNTYIRIEFDSVNGGTLFANDGTCCDLSQAEYTAPATDTYHNVTLISHPNETVDLFINGAHTVDGYDVSAETSLSAADTFVLINAQEYTALDSYKIESGFSEKPEPEPDSSGYDQTFGLDDRTGLFPTDRSTISVYTYEPGAKEITPSSDSFELSESKNFNYAGNATFSLESGDLYKITVDSGGNSWELVGYTAKDSDTYDELTIDTEIDLTDPDATPTPDPDATPTPTLGPNETPTPTSRPLPTEGPVYLGECSEPGMTTGISVEYWDPNYETTSFEYAIENDSGVLFSGTKSFDEPIGYYRGCVGSELTNVTNPDDGNTTIDYNGTKDDGTEFSGSINWSDTFSGSSGGGFGGPVDSGADSPAATWLGWLLLAAGGYVAYRRFGNGELESTIASAGSSAGSAARSVGSTARRLFGR